MSFLERRRAEKMYRDGGWGPLLSYPVAREGQAPLVFQMRLPATVTLLDLQTLADSASGAPELVAAGAEAVARAVDPAGAILVAALCGHDDDDALEVLATITVALVAMPDALDVAEGDTTDPATGTRTHVRRLSNKAVEIRKLTVADVAAGEDPVPLVIDQFLLESRYGAMSMTFGTTNPGMFGEEGREVFRKILATGFIGETPQAY